jgi:hypothetical protein
VYQKNFPSLSGNKHFEATLGRTDNTNKEPLKFWACGEENLLRGCPHIQQNNRRLYNMQESAIINDVARIMLRIYTTMDNKQADQQNSVVEMDGMITNHVVYILIDPGSNLSYVAPQTIDKCKLQPIGHAKPWLVQLATGTKRKVAEVIPSCQFILDGFPAQTTLNILPLGS